MDENRSSNYILVIMKNLNFLTVLYISVVMAYCLHGYIQENSALEFVRKISVLPVAAWKIPVIAITLYGICILLLWIENVNGMELFFKICLELGVSFCLSYILGFSYTGIVLLILADVMRYFPKSKWKLQFVIIICVFYLFTDYNLISVNFKITSLGTYLEYFQNDVRFILLGIKNACTSLNMMLFIGYTVLMVRAQLSEKERILLLNEKLNTANEELKQMNIQLEEYAKESEKAAETRERNRLAREIHDTLGHSFVGIITGIEACTLLMDVAPEATKEQLRAIADVARQGMTDVRRSVNALRPDALEKFNLEKALEQMINEIQTATSAKIIYQCNIGLNCFSDDEEDIIYRIVQESITNSIRHGKAKQIKINIDREYNILKLHIEDNGIGCSNIEKGFGLHHMDERLSMLGGKLQYNGENGFTVEAHIPIRWGREEA